MQKDFQKWHGHKKKLNDTEGAALFHEREVWWCALGENIGFEQDGDKESFERPVVILKKFNLDAALVVPLTGQPKKGKYYFPIGTVTGRDSVAVLSQVRFVDRKRLVNKICMLDTNLFRTLIQALISADFC